MCVYIHMCVCACHCTHMQSEMTCVLAQALGEPVWLLYSIMPLVTTRSALALPLHKSYNIHA